MDWVRKQAPRLQGRVLEVGAYNVNGTVRDAIDIDVGVDMRDGPGVDMVLDASSELVDVFGSEWFDGVVCCETLEHVQDWRGCVRQMWDVLKPGGWLAISVPTVAKGRHGYPNDYWRWDQRLVRQVWPDAEIAKTWVAGIAWMAQKTGPLPDLEAVELHPVP